MKWIALKERRPEPMQLCLIYAKSGDPDIPFKHCSFYHPTFGFTNVVKVWSDEITHWFPVSELPNPEEGVDPLPPANTPAPTAPESCPPTDELNEHGT